MSENLDASTGFPDQDTPVGLQTTRTSIVELTQSKGNQPFPVVIVPTAFRPGDPCPELLTEQEAISYLRLDTINIQNPSDTLQRYRALGHLRGTQLSKRVFYLRSELDHFLRKLTDKNPR